MPTILITGATDGIGYALAKRYSANGAHLVLLGRRPLGALDDPLFTTESYVQADLTDPAAPDRVITHLQAQQIETLDLLVHNAGLGYYGPVATQPVDNIIDLVDVNYRAPVALTHALVPYLRGGHITFVSSVATALPTPDYAVYTAAKAALDAFAHNLRMELASQDIGVTLLHPGATRTGMHRKANMPGDTSGYAPPEKVAAMIQAASDKHLRQGTVGFVNTLLRFVGFNFARVVDTAMKRSRT